MPGCAADRQGGGSEAIAGRRTLHSTDGWGQTLGYKLHFKAPNMHWNSTESEYEAAHTYISGPQTCIGYAENGLNNTESERKR